MPSPNKAANQAHKRLPETNLTGENNFKSKRLKFNNSFKNNTLTECHANKPANKPSTSGIEVNDSFGKNITNKAACEKKEIKMPNWMQQETGSEIANNNNAVCEICGNIYGNSNNLDFLQCTACKKWSCENCFATNQCFNCL